MIKECMEKHGNMKLIKHWKRDHVSCQLCHMPPHALFAYAWMLPFELFQQQWLMNSYHSTQLSLASTPSNKILRPKRAPTSVKHVMAPCAAKHFARRVSIQLCIHFAGTSLSFSVTYHLHISKYIMVRDSVRQGSKFGPESRPNPEKAIFRSLCEDVQYGGTHQQPLISLTYTKTRKSRSWPPSF